MVDEALVLRDRIGGRGGQEQDRERERRQAEQPRSGAQAREQRQHEPSRGAGGNPSDGHPPERLRGLAGQLLERQRAADAGAEVERPDVTHQVQPADPACDQEQGEQPGQRRARRRGRRRTHGRELAALFAGLWLAVGLWGAISYGHDYYTYRGFPPPKTPRGVSPGRLVTESFFSRSLGRRRTYLIYLPPGYASAAARGTRFPVMYLLHGSPGWPKLFVDAGALGVDMSVEVARHRIRPFLVVMPDGRNGSFKSDTEWANSPKGLFESYVLDVVRDVDARWPTIRDRRDRAIAGNSEGAYAAINVSLHNLGTFSIAESWSGYFVQKPKGPFASAAPQAIAANSPSVEVPRLRAALRSLPLHAYVYVGKHERELPKARAFVRELAANGGHPVLGVFKGGHNWRLWRREIPLMLAYASHWFGRAS